MSGRNGRPPFPGFRPGRHPSEQPQKVRAIPGDWGPIAGFVGQTYVKSFLEPNAETKAMLATLPKDAQVTLKAPQMDVVFRLCSNMVDVAPSISRPDGQFPSAETKLVELYREPLVEAINRARAFLSGKPLGHDHAGAPIGATVPPDTDE